MTPPATVHNVPITVIVFGCTLRRTSQSETGSMRRRYPCVSQSGSIFPGLRDGEQGMTPGIGPKGCEKHKERQTRTAPAWAAPTWTARSEERRVGKEGRSRWSPYH